MKPKLRFKEFIDDWEEKKLKDLIDIQMCKRILKAQTNTIGGIPFYKIGTLGKEADAFISKDLFLEYKKKYNYPKVNEVMMTCSGTVGKTFIFDGKPSYYQDSNIVWLSNDEETVLNKFLYFNLNNINWNFLTSSTITRIYANDIYSLLINIPSLPEQEKIGTFLSLVDQRIEKAEKKVSLLKEEKKGWMQKLFQQEIRFKDEQGNDYPNWEEKKLGEIVEWKKGQDLPKKHLNTNKIGKLAIHYADIYKFNEISYNSLHYTSYNEGTEVKKGNLVFPMSDVTVLGLAKVCSIQYKALAGGDILIAEISNYNVSSIYLSYFINFNKKNIYKYITGTTVKHINAKDLSKLSIPLPSLPEQEKIANFLSLLDQRIEKEERKVELLEEEKKGLLQNMFV